METPNISINDKTSWGLHQCKDGQIWNAYRNNNGYWTLIFPIKAQPSKTKSDIIVVKE